MELINIPAQTVAAGNSVLFNDSVTSGSNCILHRNGSGMVTLRGLTNQCRARFRVVFSGNIAVPTGGTVQAIQLTLTVNGEPLGQSVMIVTPAAVEEYFNVHTETLIDVPKGCCPSVTVRNTTAEPIRVQNANLIIERVA